MGDAKRRKRLDPNFGKAIQLDNIINLLSVSTSTQRAEFLRKYFWQTFINNAKCTNGLSGKDWMLGMMDDVKNGNIYINTPQKYRHLQSQTDSRNFQKFVLEAYSCGADMHHKQMNMYLTQTSGDWFNTVKLLRREINFDLHKQLLHEIIDFLFTKESYYVLTDCLAFTYVHVITAVKDPNKTEKPDEMYVLNWFLNQVDDGYSVGHVLLSNLCMHLLPIKWVEHLNSISQTS